MEVQTFVLTSHLTQPPGTSSVRVLEPGHHPRAVREYLAARESGKICHLPEWGEMIRSTFGHEPYYLVAEDSKGICGLLPLVHVSSRLFGNRLISQGCSDYGGPLYDHGSSGQALCVSALELAEQLGCTSVEFRCTAKLPYNLLLRQDKVTFQLPLDPDPEKLWRQFRPEIRNRVRKAQKSGLQVEKGGIELLDDFYQVWTARMHQLGTPCYPRSLMESILQSFPDRSLLFLVRMGEKTLGGGLTTHFKGFVDMQFVATRVEFNRLAPNVLLYWSVIEHSCLQGASCFDFGRCSIDGPTYEFKRRWGANQVPLFYQYWSRSPSNFSAVRPEERKFARKVQMWRRLPLSFTRLAGPYISRGLL